MVDENNQINLEERVKWIEYEGKKILMVDCRDLKEDDYLNAINKYDEMMYERGKDKILSIMDCTNTVTSDKIRDRGKELEEKNKNLPLFVSVVGMSGIQRIIANAIKRNMFFAGTIEEAKEWLINQ